MAFSVSSRKMYFLALIWISSRVRARLLDNELLKGSGRSPLSKVGTTAWVSNSFTSNVLALYHLRKSRSDSPYHWVVSSRLETGFDLNFQATKWAKNSDERLENLLMDLGGKELNHLSAAFFNVIENAQHLTGFDALATAILDLKVSICSRGLVLPS